MALVLTSADLLCICLKVAIVFVSNICHDMMSGSGEDIVVLSDCDSTLVHSLLLLLLLLPPSHHSSQDLASAGPPPTTSCICLFKRNHICFTPIFVFVKNLKYLWTIILYFRHSRPPRVGPVWHQLGPLPTVDSHS